MSFRTAGRYQKKHFSSETIRCRFPLFFGGGGSGGGDKIKLIFFFKVISRASNP